MGLPSNVLISVINSLHAGYFFRLLLASADIFQKKLFQKILSGTLSVSNGLDPDQDGRNVGPDLIPSVLIWAQTICKGYQQMTQISASKERAKLRVGGQNIVLWPQ